MWIIVLITIVLVVFAIVILRGRGDKFIAGYNTATEKEQQKYNPVRLRKIIAVMLLIIAGMLLLLAYMLNTAAGDIEILIFTGVFIFVVNIVCVVGIHLSNTWAKRK